MQACTNVLCTLKKNEGIRATVPSRDEGGVRDTVQLTWTVKTCVDDMSKCCCFFLGHRGNGRVQAEDATTTTRVGKGGTGRNVMDERGLKRKNERCGGLNMSSDKQLYRDWTRTVFVLLANVCVHAVRLQWPGPGCVGP